MRTRGSELGAMGPARPRTLSASRLLLLLLFLLCFPRLLWGDVVFLPSFIHMSDTSASASLIGDTENVSLTLSVLNKSGILPISDCGLQNNGTSNWTLTVTPGVGISEVTISLNSDLQSCLSETLSFSEFPCITDTLLVSASHNSSCLAHLLVQVEIYPNISFAQNVSESAASVPEQKYKPFGPCPCDLVSGACDVRCCCDQECRPNLIELFKDHCHTGVFGGQTNPPFDQLCSNSETNERPDWFPFLCVQSSLENSPFLGLFFDGSIVRHKKTMFEMPSYVPVKDTSDFGYIQGDPLITVNKTYFTIPQMSLVGQCTQHAPVAFLKDFDVKCLINLETYQRSSVRNRTIKKGTLGGSITIQVTEEQSTALDKYISNTEVILPPEEVSDTVILEEHYVFMWKNTTITEASAKFIWGKIHPNQQGMLTQRFKVMFLSFNTKNIKQRSGNPGYHFGKPVRALDLQNATNITTINLWQPVGSGLCRAVDTFTPVLFGEDTTSGCFLEVGIDENCTQLREKVTENLHLLIQATHVARKGNSDYDNINDGWEKIIWRDPPFPKDNLHLEDIKGICPDVPALMNIRFLISNGGNLEGISQFMILGTEVSFSPVTWQFECGMTCEDKPSLFLISASVQFIKIPPEPPLPRSSFQINFTDYDCNHNEICWLQLAYPLTGFYEGESYSSCLAKSLMLVFFLTVVFFFSGPWGRNYKFWNLLDF
ncbi:tectonic-2 isoform X1 [Monodelphis domestica]|uniref:tectonic-2 isoform X1 n=1 Tax=Monodelphis domestica TaxID=13616 RepID=UPI0024E1CC65|nr:tectonic-2 isoform X1 [Monodelphis domestica]